VGPRAIDPSLHDAERSTARKGISIGKPAMTRHERTFGEVSRLPSGRYRVRLGVARADPASPPKTPFATKGEAEGGWP